MTAPHAQQPCDTPPPAAAFSKGVCPPVAPRPLCVFARADLSLRTPLEPTGTPQSAECGVVGGLDQHQERAAGCWLLLLLLRVETPFTRSKRVDALDALPHLGNIPRDGLGRGDVTEDVLALGETAEDGVLVVE